jgi:hypothetical protein
MSTYNPKKCIVIFGGVEIKGFSEDSIIECEPLGDELKPWLVVMGRHHEALTQIKTGKSP